MLTVLLLLSVLNAAIYGFLARHKTVSPFRTLVKTTAIACLAAYAALSGGPLLLVAGLALSALGDFFLSRDGDTPFLAGMAAFFAAHLAYIPLFLNLGEGAALISQRWPLCLAMAIYAGVLNRILWPGLGAFRLPVAGYSLAIAFMGFAALGLPASGGTGLILLGAGFFILSDSILAVEKFRLPETATAARFTPYGVWGFYWLAQALITFGVLT